MFGFQMRSVFQRPRATDEIIRLFNLPTGKAQIGQQIKANMPQQILRYCQGVLAELTAQSAFVKQEPNVKSGRRPCFQFFQLRLTKAQLLLALKERTPVLPQGLAQSNTL